MALEEYLVTHLSPRKRNSPSMNLPVLEEETEGKKMESEIPERAFLSDFPKKSRTPRIKKAGMLETQIDKKIDSSHWSSSFNFKNQSGDDDKEEEELETTIDEKIDSPLWKCSFNVKNQSGSVKKNTILDDDNEEEEEEEEEAGNTWLPKPEFGYRIDGEKLSYSIDGKKLPKPEFGYSIDGEKLSERPQIEEILDIIGDCSKISFHRNDVKKGILPYLNEDETVKLCKEGILVSTSDEFGNRYEMKFESYNNCFYMLCNGWKRLYKYHGLKESEDCYVDVWMIRHKENDGICFTVILKR
ncbi:hypothetical protein R3W88_032530 [Solanum pinnatisectum]|uniref:TF-B3 domain-containing protein n=1 Tax=Solanum pinnatisectum TaxID=50273 RepID=A0AAV9LPL1_9SOLN|nr:hypothetical protein R3W88_032530 [Solanum pinnatisectum]